MAYATVRRDYVDVLGRIWWPIGAMASQRIALSDYDLSNIVAERITGDVPVTDATLAERFTRDRVADWLACHSGDFSAVLDFSATAGPVDIAWESEDNELAYYDTLGD